MIEEVLSVIIYYAGNNFSSIAIWLDTSNTAWMANLRKGKDWENMDYNIIIILFFYSANSRMADRCAVQGYSH